MFAVPSFFGYNTTFVSTPVATAATGVGETSFTANWNAFAGASYYLLDVSTSPSFSSFVLQDEVVIAPTTSYVVIGLTASTTYYYRLRASTDPYIDPDASAFFARVTAAGGTLSATEQTATNQLVLDMKAAGVWTKMKAVYPMVGGGTGTTAARQAACEQNLISASFTGTFTSGWTFASTGVTPNGTNAYMNTGLNVNTELTQDSTHLSYYSRTNSVSSEVEMGVTAGNSTYLLFNFSGVAYSGINSGEAARTTAASPTTGFLIGSRTSSTQERYFTNNVSQTRTANSTGKANLNIFLACYNNGGAASLFSTKQCAFSSIGDGLTDTQASNFYTAVQTFNQTLSRSVGPQIVSDADAQAYINRVYTAGGTLTNTEANAVNQLVIDMKAAGIWTLMKAIYPMVGGGTGSTAARQAACEQNLKSSSFTGTFTSGWTFASTGVTPNGTSAYMDTGLIPNTSLLLDSTHGSSYCRTNAVQSGPLFSAEDASNYNNGLYIWPNYSSGTISVRVNDNTSTGGTNTSTLGFHLANRTSSSIKKYLRNNVSIFNTTVTSSGLNTSSIYLAASRNNANYTNYEQAFASFGDGLTDTQASDFYTCVQTFQTTLSRQV